MSDKPKTIFETLASLDISKQIEKRKNGSTELSYLSWSFAWSHVKTKYPSANYKVIQFDGKPFFHDENLGYLVATEVTIEGETISMQLPVMDGANKAQKSQSYTYEVADWQWSNVEKKKVKVGVIHKTVEAATMFDINTAIMRCLVKNLAMFGLGISLYSGEDLPAIKEIKEEIENENKAQTKTNSNKSTPPQKKDINTQNTQTETIAQKSQNNATLLIQKLESDELFDHQRIVNTTEWLGKNLKYLPQETADKINKLIFEKIKIENLEEYQKWILENEKMLGSAFAFKLLEKITEKQAKVINIETNPDQITDEALANFESIPNIEV